MQFKRIKILMLVLFVLLDIFLFNWWRAGQTTNEQVADANADIIAEMKKQNIVLPTFSRSVQYNSYIAVPTLFFIGGGSDSRGTLGLCPEEWNRDRRAAAAQIRH